MAPPDLLTPVTAIGTSPSVALTFSVAWTACGQPFAEGANDGITMIAETAHTTAAAAAAHRTRTGRADHIRLTAIPMAANTIG